MRKSRQKTVNSKGQVTAFIVLGLIILGIFLLALYFDKFDNWKGAGKETILTYQASDVEKVIYQCVEDLAEEGLVEMGKHGAM
ncbi:MAG: hypothetical protein KKA79_04540 [Nanoarchaeota archaeon]|nr:hypothetical protein [Nanoarchaeota archaeon]